MKKVVLIGYKSRIEHDPFTGNYRDGSWLYIKFDSAEVIGNVVQRVWIDSQRYVPDESHIGHVFLMYKPNKHVCKFEMMATERGGEV